MVKLPLYKKFTEVFCVYRLYWSSTNFCIIIQRHALFFHFIDSYYIFLFSIRINDYGSEPFHPYSLSTFADAEGVPVGSSYMCDRRAVMTAQGFAVSTGGRMVIHCPDTDSYFIANMDMFDFPGDVSYLFCSLKRQRGISLHICVDC